MHFSRLSDVQSHTELVRIQKNVSKTYAFSEFKIYAKALICTRFAVLVYPLFKIKESNQGKFNSMWHDGIIGIK